MLPTKRNLILITTIPFGITMGLYYLFYVWIQKSSGKFCKTYYCLEIIPINDFLSVTIGVIGVIALIISLDAWKIQEKFKSESEFYISLIDNLDSLLEKLTNIPPFNCNDYSDFHSTLEIYWKCKKQLEKKEIDIEFDFESLGDFILHCISSNQENPDYLELFMMKNTKVRMDINKVILEVTTLKDAV